MLLQDLHFPLGDGDSIGASDEAPRRGRLAGEQDKCLRHIVALGGPTHRITKAIERLRRDFDRPRRIEDLARELGMSVSGFHYQFKELTGMSPLQFQKHLRLQETRRLELGEGRDAASAGYRIGYNDASPFSREYRRLFGAPRWRDRTQLRGAAVQTAGL